MPAVPSAHLVGALYLLRGFIIYAPAGAAAGLAAYPLTHEHWSLVVLAAAGAFIVAAPFGRALHDGLCLVFPALDPDDAALLRTIKLLPTESLRPAEREAWQRFTAHTPRYGEEHCSRCGIRAPARCRSYLAAEREVFALRIETRVREERAKQAARAISAGDPT